MFLMKKAQDGIKLPSQLPPELKKSVGIEEKPTSMALVLAEPQQPSFADFPQPQFKGSSN